MPGKNPGSNEQQPLKIRHITTHPTTGKPVVVEFIQGQGSKIWHSRRENGEFVKEGPVSGLEEDKRKRLMVEEQAGPDVKDDATPFHDEGQGEEHENQPGEVGQY